jgi:hypothetical protein
MFSRLRPHAPLPTRPRKHRHPRPRLRPNALPSHPRGFDPPRHARLTIVSIAGFLPWPIIDRWLPAWREMQLYIACTVIFIGLSGVCLHRLIIGPGSLPRFYKLFSLSFIAYAAGWIALWVALRDHTGTIAGGFAGTAAMGAILSLAFAAPRTMPQVIAAIFILHTLGYSAGEWIALKLIVDHRFTAVILWALCYGLGFGAGLGAAFHLCQSQAREIIRKSS